MPLPAFVSTSELADTLGVAEPDPGSPLLSRWAAALADASGYLRTVIGQPITAGTATLAVRTDGSGETDLWLVPVTSIGSVLDCNDDEVDPSRWRVEGQRLCLPHGWSAYSVEVSYGYDEPPAEIVRWTKVLANVQIEAAARGNLGLTAVTSVAVDDAKVTYTEAMAVALPASVAQWLKATFGGVK